jgi:hypothetical protein
MYVSSYYDTYMCPHTTIHICVLILLLRVLRPGGRGHRATLAHLPENVCVCVCVCVCPGPGGLCTPHTWRSRAQSDASAPPRECVCVCVCVFALDLEVFVLLIPGGRGHRATLAHLPENAQ